MREGPGAKGHEMLLRYIGSQAERAVGLALEGASIPPQLVKTGWESAL